MPVPSRSVSILFAARPWSLLSANGNLNQCLLCVRVRLHLCMPQVFNEPTFISFFFLSFLSILTEDTAEDFDQVQQRRRRRKRPEERLFHRSLQRRHTSTHNNFSSKKSNRCCSVCVDSEASRFSASNSAVAPSCFRTFLDVLTNFLFSKEGKHQPLKKIPRASSRHRRKIN